MESVWADGQRRRQAWSQTAAGLAALIGVLTVLAWLTGQPLLAALAPGEPPVRPNAALAFLATAGALRLLSGPDASARRRAWAAAGFAVAAALGGLTMLEHLFRLDLGIDRLLAIGPPHPDLNDPRMHPATAGALVLLGLGGWRLARWPGRSVDAWAVLPICLCWVRLICVGYRVADTTGLYAIFHLPVPAAVALAGLGLALLLVAPCSALRETVADPGPGGALIRRLLPVTLALPVALGWLRLAAFRVDLLSEAFGVVVMVAAGNFALTAMVIWTGRLTGRLDQARGEALEAYRDLYDRAPCGYHTLDPEGRIVRVNETQARWLGYPEAQLLRRPLAEFVADEARPALQAALEQLRVGAEYQPVETTLICADGRRLPAQLSLAGVRQADGRLGFRGTLLDMTDRVRHEQALAESEELLRGAFDQAAVGVGLVELDGRWRRVNQALCEVLGRPEAKLLGRRLDEVIHPEDREARHEETRRLLAGEAPNYRLELRCLTGEGQVVWVVINCALARDAGGRPWLKVIQMQDVTARKQAEAELARTVTELQHFAYVASHDLQEPLRKIRAFSDRLALSAGPALNDRGREYLTRIQNSAVRMSELLDALLAYSRLTSRPGTVGTVDLRQVVQEALQDLELVVQETGATVDVGPLPVVLGDPVRLREVFQNLLANALKFRAPERSPHVQVSSITDDGGIEVTVQDNGIGFEPQYAAQIFQPFQRLHRMGEYPGTGMGLAIVDRIVQRHGGTMRATGVAGQGAAFTVRLPRPLPATEET